MLDSPSQPAGEPRLTAPSRAASARAWAADWLTTTPGRLVLLTALLVAGAVGFGLIASLAERSRAHAADGVRAQTEPLLVQSVLLYNSLSDANATATTTFLKGGLEPPALRARYRADLRLASDSLATLTREVGGSAVVAAAVRTITEELPTYSGLVESARANNRQGFPVGQAYLRAASGVLTGTILPQANRVYAAEAQRLNDNYGSGTALASLVVLIVVVLVAVALLAGAQLFVGRLSRRIVNVPMLAATVVLLAVSVWAVVALVSEQNALAGARRASDSVELLSAGRVLLSRAQSDQSLILANRGSDETDAADFTTVMTALAPPRGLLGAVGTSVSPSDARRLDTEFAAYQAQAAQTATLVSSGQISEAISASPTAARVESDFSGLATAAQRRFMTNAADATGSLSGLSIALPVLAVVAGAMAVFGLRQRLEEYR